MKKSHFRIMEAAPPRSGSGGRAHRAVLRARVRTRFSGALKRSLSHVWVYVYVRTAARGWARCHCGEAVQRSEALAVWSGVDCTTYLTKAEIRLSFNVVHTAENH